jgi:hypothetical protein
MIPYPSPKLLLKGGVAGAIPSSQKSPFCHPQLSVLSFISLIHALLVQNPVLKLSSLTMSLGAQLTITFINAANSTIVKYCTARPLGP